MLLGTGLMGVVVLVVSVAGLRARPPVDTPRTQQAGVAAPAGPLPPLAWPRPWGNRSGVGAGAPSEGPPEAPPPRRSPRAGAAGGTTTGLVLRSPYRGPIERVRRAPVAKPGTAQPGTPSAAVAGPSPGAAGDAAGRPTAPAASPTAEAGLSPAPGRAALLGGPITLEELRP